MKDMSMLTKSKSQFFAMKDEDQLAYMKKAADADLSIKDLAESLNIRYETFYGIVRRKFHGGHPFVKGASGMQNYYFKMDKKDYNDFLKACDKLKIERIEGIRQAIAEFTKKYG